VAVAVSDSHYEGEAEFVFVAAVEFVELFVFFGGALVYAGGLLFLAGGGGEFFVGGGSPAMAVRSYTWLEFGAISFGVGSYSGFSGQVGMGSDQRKLLVLTCGVYVAGEDFRQAIGVGDGCDFLVGLFRYPG